MLLEKNINLPIEFAEKYPKDEKVQLFIIDGKGTSKIEPNITEFP